MGIDFALSFTLIEHKNSCETLGIYTGLLKAHLGVIMTFGNIQQKAGGKVTLLWSTITVLCQTTEKTGCETENQERSVCTRAVTIYRELATIS